MTLEGGGGGGGATAALQVRIYTSYTCSAFCFMLPLFMAYLGKTNIF